MNKLTTIGTFAAIGLAATLALPANAAAKPQVVELTQTACQFVEVETGDHGYTTQSKADCESINAESGDQRLAQSKVLKLKPGKYVFRVKNENVPYALGFWLRGEGLIGRATLPSVSGGGLTTGATKDYEITLTEGEYLFSCPLNPTPDYKLVVES